MTCCCTPQCGSLGILRQSNGCCITNDTAIKRYLDSIIISMVRELVEEYVIELSDQYIQEKVEEYTLAYLDANLATIIQDYISSNPSVFIPSGDELPTIPYAYLLFKLTGSTDPLEPDGLYYNNGTQWSALAYD